MHDIETQFRTLEAKYNNIARFFGTPTSNVDFFSHDAFCNFFWPTCIYALVQKRGVVDVGASFTRKMAYQTYMSHDPYDYAEWSQYSGQDWQSWQISRYGFLLSDLGTSLHFLPWEQVFLVAGKILDDMTSVYYRPVAEANFDTLMRYSTGYGGYAARLAALEAEQWASASNYPYIGWHVIRFSSSRWTMEERWGDGNTRTTLVLPDPYDIFAELAGYSGSLTPHVGWEGEFVTRPGNIDLGTAVGMVEYGFGSIASYDITAGITQGQIHDLLVAAGEGAGESEYKCTGYCYVIDISAIL